MKHDISPELAAAFTKRAAALGFEIRTAFANSDKKLCLIAYQGQTEVCQFELYGGMRYFPGNPLVVERKQLNALLLDMKQAHDLYADARPFVLRGIHKEDGYRPKGQQIRQGRDQGEITKIDGYQRYRQQGRTQCGG